MRRREFITALGGTALGLPSAAHAQKSAMPVIGSLSTARGGSAPLGNAFRRGLEEMGFVEGRNISIEQQRPESNDGLRDVVADLVRKRVAVIFAADNAAALAAKAATSDIPYRVCGRSRSGCHGPCFVYQPAGWQRYWRIIPGQRAGTEAVRAVALISFLRCRWLVCWSIRTIQMPKTMRGICRQQCPHLGCNCSFWRPEAARTLTTAFATLAQQQREGHCLSPPMFCSTFSAISLLTWLPVTRSLRCTRGGILRTLVA